jgi:proteasome assembly chaperone (PAC2) family protein
MDGGTEHVRWLAEPTLTNPVMIAAFTGWNDAGDAASTALRTLVETTGASALAEIDPEPFTDFATIRPHVRLDAERRREIVWPTVGVWSASLPGADVILVLGPEPSLRWRTFCEQLVGIAERFGAPMALTLGALLADVPHRRPVQLIGTASDSSLIERFDLERSRYEGPTGIVGVLQHALSNAGIPAASLWAAVPGYAAQVSSPKAALALVERACAMVGTPTPGGRLHVDALAYDDRVDALIADDDDLVAYVSRLETVIDDFDDEDLDDGDDEEADDLASVDPSMLVDEVEQFLRDHDDER